MEWPNGIEQLLGPDVDWHYNACINAQWKDLSDFARYFKEGGDSLVTSVIELNGILDALIYPIAFLYRHHIELQLKGLIATCRQLSGNKNGYPHHHNLNDLWLEAKRGIMDQYGAETPRELEYVKPCIDEFMKWDSSSFAFRYPTDKAGHANLKGLRHINLRQLNETIDKISNLLGCLWSDLGDRLDYERENR